MRTYPDLYKYTPSLIATIIAASLYGVSTLLHCYQLMRTRSWYMIPMLTGVTIEVIGYGARIYNHHEAPDYTLPAYIVQATLILIAPALFAASVYMILGYIILAVDGERHSLIREKWLTKIFVIGDVFSFLIQSSGAGFLTQTKNKNAPKLGKIIVVGGLAIQLIFFGFFMVVTMIFYSRIARRPTARSRSPSIPWRKHLIGLFTASILIFVRSVFRVIEYIQGTNGYLLTHEIYLYTFDAALMLFVVYIFNLLHPSQITGLLTGKGILYKVLHLEPREKLTKVEGGQFVRGPSPSMYPLRTQYDGPSPHLEPLRTEYAPHGV